jgi:hypothetical protein
MTLEELELFQKLRFSDWEPGRAVAGALAAILQERDEAKARVKELEAALGEAIEFADQDVMALTPAGEMMVSRWRAARGESE